MFESNVMKTDKNRCTLKRPQNILIDELEFAFMQHSIESWICYNSRNFLNEMNISIFNPHKFYLKI